MHRQAVGKQSELFFKELRPPVCFLRGKSVAVAVERVGTRVPEFTDILRGKAKLAIASTSVVGSKAANGGRVKTGQRM